MINFVLTLASSLIINIAQAATPNSQCVIESVVKCICSASMSVTCNGNAGTIKGSGHVKNKEPVKGAVLKLRDKNSGTIRELTVKEDDVKDLFARDFYNIDSNVEFRQKLNVKDREEIIVDTLELDPTVKLYEDADGINEIKHSSTASAFSSCSYVDSPPSIINMGLSCHGKKVCVGRIKCQGIGEGLGACPVKLDGSCPTASECAADQQIQMDEDPGKAEFIKASAKNMSTLGK